MEPKSLSKFATWIENKKVNDYWYSSDIPNDYALRKFSLFQQQLENKSLLCKHITWFITNRCDLSCSHCGTSANEREFSELTLEQIASLIPDLKKIGVEYIAFSGGEPFVRKDIFKLIGLLKLCGFYVGVITNGTKLVNNYQNLKKYTPDSITISIDGLEAAHDKIRLRPGSFKETIKAIQIAKDAGVKIVSIHTCVYPQNINDLEQLKEIIFGLGINQWILRPIFPSGRARQKLDYQLDNQQILNLLNYAKKLINDGLDVTIGGDLGYLGNLDSIIYLMPYFCSVGWDSLIILPNGDIKGFDEPYLPVEGNVLQGSLTDIWTTGFKYYREPLLPETCYNCEFFSKCRGGFIPGAESGKRCIKPILTSMI